ncbi:uncharacterized protein LOC126769198 [Nymphalis io]|uniref:uncharacterized protein LOC126769198 n=1 Tax=Inachis io TaxID=171585 RepID=UPI002168511D|nr:uncharacterized protein LOC126769198 [Nymphalis io]
MTELHLRNPLEWKTFKLISIYVTASTATPSDHCNEFTVTVDEIVNVDQISTFDRDSFGILNNLTKQCRFLNIAVELDLYRDETSKYYIDVYRDDLHKINVKYPIDDYVNEEVNLTPDYTELFQNPRERPTIPEYDTLKPYEHETTSNYPQYTTIFEATTEISTTDISYVLTNDNVNKSDAKKLKNEKNKEDSGMTAVIVVASVAAVASAAIISYYVAHMIKTMLQSGSYRFPEPAA